MGLLQIVKAGVVQGDYLEKTYGYSKKNNFAILCVNVLNTESINAVLESALHSNSAVMVQVSYENAKFFAGKIPKGDSSVLGAVSIAHYLHTIASYYKVPVILGTNYVSKENINWINELLEIGAEYYKTHSKSLFSSYSLDITSSTSKDGIKTAKKYLKKASKIGSGLDIKLGKNFLIVEDLSHLYNELQQISSNFTISLAFDEFDYDDKQVIFSKLQKVIQNEFKTKSKPLNLVCSGDDASKKDIQKIINAGTVLITVESDVKNSFSNTVIKDTEATKVLRESQKKIIKNTNSRIKEYNAKNSL